MTEYKPGIYVKDGVERVANTPSRAVALVFEGFKLKPEEKATKTEPKPSK